MQRVARLPFTVVPVVLCSALTLATSLGFFTNSATAAEPTAQPTAQQVTVEGREFVLAARFGHDQVITNKLNSGTDIEVIDELGNTALIAAAAENQLAILMLLLEQGANVDAQSSDGTSALMNAATHGNLGIAKVLVAAGSQIDLKKQDGTTALVSAVQYGHLPMINLLLENGADANVVRGGSFKDGAGLTPLMYAAQHGWKGAKGDWPAITATLLKHGAQTNLSRANGDNALTIAQWHQHSEIVDLLSEAGARDETHYAALTKDEALVKAAKIGDLAKTRVLLEQEANVNYRDRNNGVTPLLTAIYYENLAIVRALIESGADINHVPWGLKEQRIASSSISFKERELLRTISRGDTALIVAIQKNSEAITRYLIEKGAKISVANRKKETPTLLAVRNGNATLTALLLESGADPDRATFERKVDTFITRIHKQTEALPLLVEAAKRGHTETVKILLKAGAEINIQDSDGRTALYKAAEQGYAKTVDLLLAEKADTNLYDNIGRTPLMVASRNGYQIIVESLIAHGANVNAIEQLDPNSHRDIPVGGMTALIYASRGGHAEITGILLKNGADRRLSSNTGETALGAARQHGFKQIEQMLAGGELDD